MDADMRAEDNAGWTAEDRATAERIAKALAVLEVLESIQMHTPMEQVHARFKSALGGQAPWEGRKP
jgi:hypothetical protein